MLADERRRRVAERLREQGSISVAEVESSFAVSAMTARRDLAELERRGLAQRTHGGAILPGLSRQEDSFRKRLETDVGPKRRLAAAAVADLAPGEAVFVDSSTSGYFAAEQLLADGVQCTLLTNAVAVIDLACEAEAAESGSGLELIGIGGSLRTLTRSFVGPLAIRGVEAHYADHVLFSVRGVTHQGDLTDPDSLEAEVKRAMIRRARRVVLLVDGSKFDRAALSVIAHVGDVDLVLAADVPDDELALLSRLGVETRAV